MDGTAQYVIDDPRNKLEGYVFPFERINAVAISNTILSLRLESHYKCNLNCIYCYSRYQSSGGDFSDAILPFEDACDIVLQAKDNGAESVIYLGGGEPLLYDYFWELIEFIANQSMIPVVFTNGLCITSEIASRLFALGASVIIKMDGRRHVQEMLTGKGSFDKIETGFKYLFDAGFAQKSHKNSTRLGIAPCVNIINVLEIPNLWRFARRNNIFPNIEIMTVVGNAKSELSLDRQQYHNLLKTLRRIDFDEFGLKWSIPYSSMMGHSCGIIKAGISVNMRKEISCCPELPPVASLRMNSLKEILKSKFFRKLRDIENNIYEPCKSCQYISVCCGGCRSKAFHTTHDYFSCDPYCEFVV